MSLVVDRPRRKAAVSLFVAGFFGLCANVGFAQTAEDAAAAPEAPVDEGAATAPVEDSAVPVTDAATEPASADATASTDAAPADAGEAAPVDAAAAAPEAAPAATVDSIPVAQPAEDKNLAVTEGASKLDTIEVTGSRLRRTDYETAQPVSVIGREDIERSGLTNIGDLLMRISAAGTSINTTASTIFLAGGETNLDLRNLGTNRVLVLVNGRRWVNGLISTSTSAVDLNTIPTAIIERVEVLKDGASAIYGSDAIAGVVNIITRKNYVGTELSSQYGVYHQGDGATQQHQLSVGNVGDSTSWFANISYTQQEGVKTTDRDIAKYGPGGPALGKTRWNGIGPEGRLLFIPTPATYALLGPQKCPLLDLGIAGGAGIPLCDISHTAGTPGTTPLDFHRWNPETDSYNRYLDSNLQNPSRRLALFTQLNQKLLDSVSFNFEGLYNVTKNESQLRPQALAVGDLLGDDTYVAADNIYNPLHQDIGRGTPTGFCDPNDPLSNETLCSEVGADALVGEGVALLRLVKFPPVLTTYDVKTLRLGGGFDGNFDIMAHNFSWDLGYAYARSRKEEVRLGDYRKDRAKLALGPAANCTGDCVPLNVFAGQDGLTPEMIQYLALRAVNHTESSQKDAYLNFSTDLGAIQLPAGPIAVAFGIEYRREDYDDMPDALLVQGLSSGNNSAPTAGETTAKEAYAEIGVPLLSAMPGVESLDLSLAGRRSNYGDFGNANTYKVGLRWKPVSDLLLRGTYSTAFRAPSVGELFLGDSDSFDTVIDPCSGNQRNDPTTNANCTADGVPQDPPTSPQLRSTFGGNDQLDPETAKTLTYGFVFSPDFAPESSLALDYYRIRLSDYITTPGSQFILDSCYTNEGRNLCQYVHRNQDGALSGIENRYVNFAGLNTSGIDANLVIGLPAPSEWGKFKVTLDASYLMRYDYIQPTANGGTTTQGQVGQSGGFVFIPRWKANGELTWKIGQFDASWATRMVYKVRESCVDAVPNILAPGPTLAEAGVCSNPKFEPGVDENGDPVQVDVSENVLPTHFYHDVRVGYTLADQGLALALGVKNVLNTEPPFSYDPSTGGAYFNYNVLSDEIPGRFPYVRVELKF